jgi:hypothetical protein
MYSAMLLLRSHSLYFKLSGFGAAGIMVLPVLIALVAYWRRGGFEPDTGLLNRDDVAEPGMRSHTADAAAAGESSTAISTGETAPPDSLPYRPLGSAVRWIAVGLLALGAASLVVAIKRAPPPTPSSSRRAWTPPLSSASPILPPIGAVPIRSPASISSSGSPSAPPPPSSSATAPYRSG